MAYTPPLPRAVEIALPDEQTEPNTMAKIWLLPYCGIIFIIILISCFFFYGESSESQSSMAEAPVVPRPPLTAT